MRQTNRGKRQIGKWLLTILTVAWMAVIFAFSAQPAEESGKTSLSVGGTLVKIFVPDFEEWSGQEQAAYVEKINHPIRKMGHATEYAILGVCLMMTVCAWDITEKKAAAVSFMFGAVYACTDEFHQLFVPGRSAQVTDVLIDSAGVLAGVTVAFLIVLAVGHKRRTWETVKETEGEEAGGHERQAPEGTKEYEKRAKEEAYGEETGTDFDQNAAAGTGAAGANGI